MPNLQSHMWVLSPFGATGMDHSHLYKDRKPSISFLEKFNYLIEELNVLLSI